MGKRQMSLTHEPPESRQHFDIWQFPTTNHDAGPELLAVIAQEPPRAFYC